MSESRHFTEGKIGMRKVTEESMSKGISKTIWFPSLHCGFASDLVKKNEHVIAICSYYQNDRKLKM